MRPYVPDQLPIPLSWEPLIPLIGRTNRSIAQYEGVLYAVPNPEVLLSPLTTQEAVLSSKIEGTQATLGEVLRFDAGEEPPEEARRTDYREIINYRVALRHAESELVKKPFNLNLLLKLHEILLNSVRGKDKALGRFRTIQNWIGTQGSPIENADFVPPEPTLLPSALDRWEKYFHGEQPDPLVQLAIVHAQFEIIHPFLDGNGRLGRILVPLFLYEKKLLSRPMFYLSAYLDEHRDEYIQRLRAIGGNPSAWNDWVEFFLRALDEQAKANATRARAILDLYEQMKSKVIALTHSQYAIPLLDRIFERPIFAISQLNLGGGSAPTRQSISGLVRTLRQQKILKVIMEASGRRPQILAFTELLNLCEGRDAF